MLHDAHTHTLHSDGLGEVFENIAEAERKGLSLVAITDHSHYVLGSNFNAYLNEIRRWGEDSGIKVLAGIEGNITPNGVDVPAWAAEKLDFVIASVHEWVDRPEEYVGLVKAALIDENVDIIGHFGASFPYIGYPPWEDLVELIELAEENGKAFEISSRYRVPDLEFVRECIRRGVKLTFASDAHRPEKVGNVGWSVSIFRKAGGKPEDLLFEEFL
ncbi:MAG: PHP domain-containing protein [Thermococcus sp.]|nr:PHP domain-containing protein [Thermococcus sp.]